MADAVTSITHWRRARDVRLEHTREVVHDVPKGAVDAMVRLADELESAKARLARLERVIAKLATQAAGY